MSLSYLRLIFFAFTLICLFLPIDDCFSSSQPNLWKIDSEEEEPGLEKKKINLSLIRKQHMEDDEALIAFTQQGQSALFFSPKNEDIAESNPPLLPSKPGPLDENPPEANKKEPQTILINFTNVSMIEFIRFLSRVSNKNFVFNESDLQFNVTIVSEEPTTIDDVMVALIQELRIHELNLLEQGNNIIIHHSPTVNGISRVVNERDKMPAGSEIVTQVFRLNTLDPTTAMNVVRPLTSVQALIEASDETRHIIVTDISSNVLKIDKLLKSLDAPNSGLVIGSYRVESEQVPILIEMAQKIMEPIASRQTLTFVPHISAKVIFVVSSPFLVEKAISILKELDKRGIETQIFELETLTPLIRQSPPKEGVPSFSETFPLSYGKWELDSSGGRIFRSENKLPATELPQGEWILDPQNNWYFVPKGSRPPFSPSTLRRGLDVPSSPLGKWTLTPDQTWVYQLSPGEKLQPERLSRIIPTESTLPLGAVERTEFKIYKLRYRKGSEIVTALRSIAESLSQSGINADLLHTISSAQWIETSNSLIFIGTQSVLSKIEELIEKVDVPLKQVFIEVLIMQVTLNDSLNFGVSWGSRSGGGQTATAQAFLSGASPLSGALTNAGNPPNSGSLAQQIGFNLGIIGQTLTHNGTQFSTISALVTAIHQQDSNNILLNPKILVEDNTPAEVFVGINTPFQTQAISNDVGSIITTNVQFQDVGTTLRVTPYLGSDDMITLDIEEERSSLAANPSVSQPLSNLSVGPTTNKSHTKTRFHLPDGYFLVMSGMIDTEERKQFTQVPCLGGLPFIGAAFRGTQDTTVKNNLMVFIRPQIVNTEEAMMRVTAQQEHIYDLKNKIPPSWKYEVEGAFDYLNIPLDCCDQDCCE